MTPSAIRPAMARVKLRDGIIADFQRLIRDMYHEKDVARGIDGTFMWLMEEVGELAAALRNGTHEERLGEFADVLAWLTTIANVAGVDLTRSRSPASTARAAPAAASSSAPATTRRSRERLPPFPLHRVVVACRVR